MNGNGVLLDRGDYWGTIPLEVQRRIEAGVERVRSARNAIAQDAKVKQMPPVTIDPAVWGPPGGGVVHAASAAWPSKQGGHTIGVILGAGPALCTDDQIVRMLLVHEFAHCFEIATRVIDNLDRGVVEDLTGDSLDVARERAMLGNPSDWFGTDDLPIVVWGAPQLQGLNTGLQDLLDNGHLPFTRTPLVKRGRVLVPNEWATRIRSLKRTRV